MMWICKILLAYLSFFSFRVALALAAMGIAHMMMVQGVKRDILVTGKTTTSRTFFGVHDGCYLVCCSTRSRKEFVDPDKFNRAFSYSFYRLNDQSEPVPSLFDADVYFVCTMVDPYHKMTSTIDWYIQVIYASVHHVPKLVMRLFLPQEAIRAGRNLAPGCITRRSHALGEILPPRHDHQVQLPTRSRRMIERLQPQAPLKRKITAIKLGGKFFVKGSITAQAQSARSPCAPPLHQTMIFRR